MTFYEKKEILLKYFIFISFTLLQQISPFFRCLEIQKNYKKTNKVVFTFDVSHFHLWIILKLHFLQFSDSLTLFKLVNGTKKRFYEMHGKRFEDKFHITCILL